MASSGDLKKKRLKKKAVLKSPSGVKRNKPKVSQRSVRVEVKNLQVQLYNFRYFLFILYNRYFWNLSGSTFKDITVNRSRLGVETKIQEKIIRKFMKLARSKEAKKLFEKDPCKIFTDRYILVRNHGNLAKTYSYSKHTVIKYPNKKSGTTIMSKFSIVWTIFQISSHDVEFPKNRHFFLIFLKIIF